MWLLAQGAAAADPISGGAGWVGAGLLGLVLAWLLLKHLPEKDKQIYSLIEVKDKQLETIMGLKDQQIKDVMAAKTAQMTELLSSHAQHVDRMHRENKDMMAQVIAHCKEEMEITNQLLQKDLNGLGEALEELTEQLRENTKSRPRRNPPLTGPT